MGERCKKIHLQPGCCCTCTLATPYPTPTKKLAGSASISGMVSGKSGVDMSTPVHPVATPLVADDRQTTDGRTTTYSEHEHEFTFAKNRSTYNSPGIAPIS